MSDCSPPPVCPDCHEPFHIIGMRHAPGCQFGKAKLGSAEPVAPPPHQRTTDYVVGFVFCGDAVLLIRKARPSWQAGRLNGVGGHIEAGEAPEEAMAREFEEETGWQLGGWEHFVTLTGDDSNPERRAAGGSQFGVWFFCAQVAPDQMPPTFTESDEPVAWFNVAALPGHVLPNLRWLIPLAWYAHRYDWPLLVRERAALARAPQGDPPEQTSESYGSVAGMLAHARRVAAELRRLHPAPTDGSEDSVEGEATHVIRRLTKLLTAAPVRTGRMDLHDELDRRFPIYDDFAAFVRGVSAPQGDPPRYENDLAHLATLAPNWDSYGGVPITPAALAAVRAFIAQLQIVPRSNGGLQIEIHKEHHDLEVSFEPDGRIEEVYVENPDVGVPAPQGDAPPLRAPNNPHERKQRERLAAGDVDGFKRELLRSVQLYADVEAGRTCMGSPVIAENVLAGIAHQLDMLAVRGGASSSGSAPGELPVCANCGAVQLVRRASCPPAPSPERIERELRDGLYVAAALLCETRRHAGARPCSFCTGQIIAPYSEANIEARVDRGSPRPPEEER